MRLLGVEKKETATFFDPWGAMMSLWWMFSHVIQKIRREK
jgi:hypothetical protein